MTGLDARPAIAVDPVAVTLTRPARQRSATAIRQEHPHMNRRAHRYMVMLAGALLLPGGAAGERLALDDTWEGTHTIGADEDDRASDHRDPAQQVEEQLEREGRDPQAADSGPQTGAAWMHRYDQIGLYGLEQRGDSGRLEGIYFHGYQGHGTDGPARTGLVSILSADLPVAADENGLGNAYLGFGLQAAAGRLTFYATAGAVYARTVRSTDDTESDTSLGADAGIKVGLSRRSMITVALREDPNELIDDRTARVGIHLGRFHVGLRQRLDRDQGRLDLAIRF